MKSLKDFEQRLKEHNLKAEELQKKLASYQKQLTEAEDEFDKSLLSNDQTEEQEEILSKKMAQLEKAVNQIKKQITQKFSPESFKRVHNDLPGLFKEDLKALRVKTKEECGVVYTELEKIKVEYHAKIKVLANIMKGHNKNVGEVQKVLKKNFGYTPQEASSDFGGFKESNSEPLTPHSVLHLINPEEVLAILETSD
jgi:chromosome segregation ATPase